MTNIWTLVLKKLNLYTINPLLLEKILVPHLPKRPISWKPLLSGIILVTSRLSCRLLYLSLFDSSG